MLTTPNRTNGVGVLFGLAFLALLAVVELCLYVFVPAARRWLGFAVWTPTIRVAVGSFQLYRQRKAGTRLLRAWGLVNDPRPGSGEYPLDYPAFLRVHKASYRNPVTFICPALPGLTPARLQSLAEARMSLYRADLVEVAGIPGSSSFRVDWLRHVVLETTLYPESGLAPSVKALPVGMLESGELATVPVEAVHMLVGGVPGGGKSNFISAVLCSAVQCRNIRVWAIDLKRGVELSLWQAAVYELATTLEEADSLLSSLLDEMDARYDELKARGRRKVVLSETHPLELLVIDELAELFNSGEDAKADKARVSKVRRLLALGRAAGFSVLLSTQRPSADLIPSSVRDLTQIRVAFKTATRDMSKMILGDIPETAVEGPESIGPEDKGVGFLLAEGHELVRFKTFLVADEAIPRIIGRAPAKGWEVFNNED